MNRVIALPLLLALAACNARDEGNGTTVLSVDQNAVEEGFDQAGNALQAAGNEVEQAAERAGPVLENAADRAGPAIENAAERTGAAAERAGDQIEGAVRNTDVDVDVTTGREQNR